MALSFLFFGAIALAATAFWIWMLVDALINEPGTSNEKIIWVLVIVFVHFIGALIYFFARRPNRIRETGR